MVNTNAELLGRRPWGHGGVILINEQTALTRYYEYGRYDPKTADAKGRRLIGVKLTAKEGNIRKVDIPNALIGPDGKATPESLKKIYKYLSKSVGQGKKLSTKYYEDADFNAMEDYVNEVANDKDRDEYGLILNNCFDFAEDVVDKGRAAE